MNIRQFIQGLLGKESSTPRFQFIADSQGLNFILPDDVFRHCQSGDNSLDDAVQYQFITLQMLAEEGRAQALANGFFLTADNAVSLSGDERLLLQLPAFWPGRFEVSFSGQTTHPAFKCELHLLDTDGSRVLPNQYRLNGPFLKLTETEQYLPSNEQWHLIQAVVEHNSLSPAERGEYENLLAVYKMQQALSEGCQVDLGHFRELEAVCPDGIGVDVQIVNDGSALITPTIGHGVDTSELEARLGQLDKDGRVKSLRVGKRIVLLEEQKLGAVQEILSARKIPKEQVKRFFETPSAFLNAAMVDLDQGFSLRVCGATEFQHAYFGEVEASGVDWFAQQLASSENEQSIAGLCATLETEEQVDELKERVNNALNVGATAISVEGKSYDISDEERTRKLLNETRSRIQKGELLPELSDSEVKDERVQLVLDVIENDEDLGYGSDDIPQKIRDVSYQGDLNYSYLKLKPFPHQDEGIRWLLGLAEPSFQVADHEDSLHGGLLADDMGLGKTFMSLVAVSEYYRMCRERGITERPVLVVAPLSLLENWRDEIEKYFHRSPFDSVVILQSNADLKKFRLQGAGSELKQAARASLMTSEESMVPNEGATIRYSLKVGPGYGSDRLDLPRRLVLTTYQALRDYQFSLCRIDWSFMICDEAQAIKSPNTLATRAAKALKARFRLLATGTPVENHLGDFWCLMDTVKPGALGAYQEFRQAYMVPIAKAGSENQNDVKEQVGTQLRHRVGALMLRRLKEDNLEGLPAKRHWVGVDHLVAEQDYFYAPYVAGDMQGRQLSQYNRIVADVLDAKTMGSTQGVILPAMLKLREISIHQELEGSAVPGLPESPRGVREFMAQSAKMASVLSILDEIRERQEKVIIFAMNKRLQTLLKLALKRIYGVQVEIINGDTKAVVSGRKGAGETRKGLISRFESGFGFGVIIMSPIAAGAGLTVVGANNVIHLERHWNPAKEAQATDRVYRIGQEKEVNVYLPMALHPCNNSFDLNLHTLLCSKTTLKDAVITPEEVSPEMLASCLG